MMGLDLILILGIAAAIAYARGWRPPLNLTGPANTSLTPLDTLKLRYARGEITRDEYDRVRRDLGG